MECRSTLFVEDKCALEVAFFLFLMAHFHADLGNLLKLFGLLESALGEGEVLLKLLERQLRLVRARQVLAAVFQDFAFLAFRKNELCAQLGYGVKLSLQTAEMGFIDSVTLVIASRLKVGDGRKHLKPFFEAFKGLRGLKGFLLLLLCAVSVVHCKALTDFF